MKSTGISKNPDSRSPRNAVYGLLESGRWSKEFPQTRKVFKMYVGGHGFDFSCERQAIRDVMPEICRKDSNFMVFAVIMLTLP